MKNTLKLTIPTLAVFALSVLLFFPTAQNIAYAESGIYQHLNDNIIELYEEDIAGKKVVSDMPEKDLETLAERHGFTLQKTKALIILSDLSFRVNEPAPFNTLATMRDVEIIRLGKHLFDLYGKTLSDEQKSALKSKALNALKSN